MAFRILGIGSSLRDNASSTNSLSITLDLAKKYGAETRLLDLRQTRLPLFDPAENKSNDEIQKAQDDVMWADALILSTPDYHGSMSGAMKNFLDYFWAEFAGKTFGYICSSHEKGLTAMDQMRTVVRQCYGWSMPYGVSVVDRDDFTDGKIAPKLESRLDMLARDLVVYGNILRQQFVKDLGDSDNTFASRYRK
ncbi:putative NADPH-dependent FMN reductase [Nitrosotalea devaniterrae]|uniref:Putative NADPH-dependent FMN reductase n=1 Tax=Nitrosotalea devaniterrae TaxID=1078905 RepID=A0A128A469_9ARCH|nr:putative NADPH-dependent FMN reductase [Candidatus Nitrosotalea devanaterra]